MTKEQEAMLFMIIKQNDAVLEMNWQLLQTLAPLPPMEFADDFDGSQPVKATLQ